MEIIFTEVNGLVSNYLTLCIIEYILLRLNFYLLTIFFLHFKPVNFNNKDQYKLHFNRWMAYTLFLLE